MSVSEELLCQKLSELSVQTDRRPTFAVKSEMIALLLREAELEVSAEDKFVCRLGHLHLMENFRSKLRRSLIRQDCPEDALLCELITDTGIAVPGVDTGHIGPDWDALIREGVPGLIARLKSFRQKNPQQAEYYDHCLRVYEALQDCFARWSVEAEKVGNSFVAENMAALSQHAPQTLAQAMQLTILFYRLIMDLDVCFVRSLGGLDHLYAPFYDKEQDAQHRALTRAFLQTLCDQKAGANLPFYICNAQGQSWPYTWVLLEEYRAMGLYDPKIHVMYHKDLDRALVLYILDTIREGKNSFVFINTEVARRALEHTGISPEDSQRLTVYGCYEPAAEGTEVPCTCASYVNMVKALELALHNGMDPKSGKQLGPCTGTEFASYEELLAAVRTQLSHLIDQTAQVLICHDRFMHRICPSLFMSPTYESSISRGIELYDGGAKYNNTSIVGVGIATLVDSLMALKQVVFDRKLVSLEEFNRIVDANWEDQPRLQHICLSGCKKYGNNDPEADALAKELVDLAAGSVNGRKNGRGGVFRWGQFSVNLRIDLGVNTGATPDGRLSGEPLSKNATATIGQDKKGVTALLSSILKLDASRIPDGVVADVVLHHSAVKGEEGMAAFYALLTTFVSQGGSAIHFNVLSPEALKKAQKEPEKYSNLQVRLCGWNVRFIDLSRPEQDEFILQAENIQQ